ncbi:MAG TPA: hypothetical protein VFX50_06070 [Gemmatimonadales bacterium]|nr:hypothetical protein [Gemmatimonadales bacterium]
MLSMPVQKTLRSIRPAFAAVFFLLGSCMAEPEVDLPEGAEAFTPPEAYVRWWSSTEACSDLSGDMGRIRWYVVPGASTFATDQGEKVGIRIKTGDEISVVLAGNYQLHEMVVRHEMLHALLSQPGHPEEYFVTRCRLTWESWSTDQPSDQTAVAELS